MFKFLGAAVSGALLLVASAASAVPVYINGAVNITGITTNSDDPFVQGSTVTLGPSGLADNGIGDFSVLNGTTTDLTSVTWVLDSAPANAGLSFTIGAFDFVVTQTTSYSVSMEPFGLVTAIGTVSAAGFDTTGAIFSLAANNQQDGYTMGITATNDAPPIPLPAALPMLVGALGLLGAGAARKRFS